MAENKEKQAPKFPSEMIDLPSGGKIYGKDSPLYDGKIEIKYMTAKEEDILTSQNLIKKGLVLDKLLESLIITPSVSPDDLLTGDKNAIMIASRILAYGPEYTCEVTNPSTGENIQHTFNLADCPFKELPKDVDYSINEFSVELPVSKNNITFKLLTGKDEHIIDRELKSRKKLGGVAPELTTRLKYIITSLNGDDNKSEINSFVDNLLLSKDSLFLRTEVARISPDIDMKQEIDIEGDLVEVDIPMTVSFLWPSAKS